MMDKIKDSMEQDEQLLKRLGLTREEALVICFIAENSMISLDEVQRGTGLDSRKLKRILKKLISRGYIGTLVTDSQYQL
jgi:DNA-binding MarR family transcriptional regulator